MAEEHTFTDPISGQTMTLVFGPEPLAPYDGTRRGYADYKAIRIETGLRPRDAEDGAT